MAHSLIDRTGEILRENDLGAYTVPTRGLYPFQWNWDSCLSALGMAHFSEARAWTEIDTLFAHQWDDGMVPHIVFHRQDDGYFPGPEVWRTGRRTATSGITQPPVAGFVARRLYERATDRALAAQRARALLPRIDAWHEWFFRCRDPNGTGLVAIIHPWESGRDNSVDWDAALDRVPTAGVAPFTRRDTQRTNPAHRPTQAQYERWLVQRFRSLGWDNSRLHDLTFSDARSRLQRHPDPLVQRSGRDPGRGRDRAKIAALRGARRRLPRGSRSSGKGPAFWFPATIRRLPTSTLCATGAAWLIVNYMIADGLRRAGKTDIVSRIVADSVRLIEQGGFAEYYNPIIGEPCGGARFTWTAAMVIEFLRQSGRQT